MATPSPKAFAALLQSVVHEPGTLSQAYQQFHTYSLGNQLLAMFQCAEREIQPGPMATYPRWRELGRQVKKGEKALTLCMPIQRKRKAETTDPDTGEPATEDTAWTDGDLPAMARARPAGQEGREGLDPVHADTAQAQG